MGESDGGYLLAALQAMADRERDARDRLLEARDERNDRDQRYAALEADLWARLETHELNGREKLAQQGREVECLREEAIRLREEATRLRVRLERIQATAPVRVYTRLRALPVVRAIAARRTREYEAALRSRLRG